MDALTYGLLPFLSAFVGAWIGGVASQGWCDYRKRKRAALEYVGARPVEGDAPASGRSGIDWRR